MSNNKISIEKIQNEFKKRVLEENDLSQEDNALLKTIMDNMKLNFPKNIKQSGGKKKKTRKHKSRKTSKKSKLRKVKK